MRKDCWIINKLTNQTFYGSLNTEIIASNDYPYLEIPEEFIGKDIKWCTQTNRIILNSTGCFKKEVEYQEKCFKEFEDDICFDIVKADIAGVTTTVNLLKQLLEIERVAVISRINAITEKYYGE